MISLCLVISLMHLLRTELDVGQKDVFPKFFLIDCCPMVTGSQPLERYNSHLETIPCACAVQFTG